MLGKLIKHEFKATGRMFLLLYAFIVLLTPVFSLFFRLADGNHPLQVTVGGLSIFGYVLMCVAVFFATYIFIVMRYYRTLATSEAYLTFTLPVNTHQIIISKVLVAFVWSCTSTLLFIISIISMTFISGIWTFDDAGEFLSLLFDVLSMQGVAPGPLFWILFFLSMIVGVILTCLQFLFSIAVGQLSKSHRVLMSVGIYFASYMVIQWITTLVTFPIMLVMPQEELIETAHEMEVMYDMLTLTLGISLLLSVIFGTVFYIVSARLLKKRLNVL